MATQPQQTPTFELGVIPDQKKADALTKNLLKEDFEIKDETTNTASWAVIQRIDSTVKLLCEGDPTKKIVGFDAFVNGLDKMHKAAVALRRQFVGPLLARKQFWLDRRTAYRKKIEAENSAKAEKEAAAWRVQQAKALEKDAKKLEKRGEDEAAEVLRSQAATLPTPAIAPAPVTRQAGSVITKFWDFTVDDYSKVPEAFRMLDPAKETQRKIIDSNLDALISKLGDKAQNLVGPAVKIFQSERESSRGPK